MRVSSLQLTNFRGFDNATLQVDPQLTVLVGVNGAGKTSVLDAFASLLSQYTHRVLVGFTLGDAPPPLVFSQRDVRVGAKRCEARVGVEVAGASVSWGMAFPAEAVEATFEDLVRSAAEEIRNHEPRYLAVYFPWNRSEIDIPQRIRTKGTFESPWSLFGELEGGSDFRGFYEWFKEQEDNTYAALARDETFTSAFPEVRRAIETFMGAADIRIDRNPNRMTLLRDGVRIEVAQLSAGERGLLAMVGDLAFRMASGVELDESLKREAVVLIDEVELHLHPGLQRQILPRLLKTFPNTQFIVTTHSPQVLASVRSGNVRLIDNFKIKPLERSTWQRDTNSILESVFGDPGRPPEVAKLLAELEQAVETDEVEQARALIRELKEKVEGTDPDVLFWEQLLPPETTEDASEQGAT